MYINNQNRKETTPIGKAKGVNDAIFSMRKEVSSYDGACCTLVRDQDNEETNIGFDLKTGELNISRLKTFRDVSGYTYFKNWYDQNFGSHHVFSDVLDQRPFLHFIDELNSRKYLKFNGITSSVDCGTPTELNNIWSGGGVVSGWLRSSNANFAYIVSKNGASSGWYIARSIIGKFLRFSHFSTGTRLEYVFNFNFTLNKWDYIEVSFNKDIITNLPKCFINGVGIAGSVTSVATGVFNDDSLNTLNFGADVFGATSHLNGFLADLKLYKSTGLTADYRLDEESVTVATDYLNGNNGVIYNGSWIVEDRHKPQRVLDSDGVSSDSTPNFNQIVLPNSPTYLDNIWSGGGQLTFDIFLRNEPRDIFSKLLQTNSNAFIGYFVSIINGEVRLLHSTTLGNIVFITTNANLELNRWYRNISIEYNKSVADVVIKIDGVTKAFTVTNDGGTARDDSSCLYATICSRGVTANNNTLYAYESSLDGAISNVKIYKAGVLSAHYLDSSAKNEAAGLTGIEYINGLNATVENAIAVNTERATMKVRNNNILKFQSVEPFYKDFEEITILTDKQEVQSNQVSDSTYQIGRGLFFLYDTGNDTYALGRTSALLGESYAHFIVSNAVAKVLGISGNEFAWDAGSYNSVLTEQTTTSNKVYNNNTELLIDMFDNAVVGDDLTPSVVDKTGICQANVLINNLEAESKPSTEYLLKTIVIKNGIYTDSQKEEIYADIAIKNGQL